MSLKPKLEAMTDAELRQERANLERMLDRVTAGTLGEYAEYFGVPEPLWLQSRIDTIDELLSQNGGPGDDDDVAARQRHSDDRPDWPMPN